MDKHEKGHRNAFRITNRNECVYIYSIPLRDEYTQSPHRNNSTSKEVRKNSKKIEVEKIQIFIQRGGL